MFIDSGILRSPLSTHVQSDGSNIGGCDPASYGFVSLPGPDGGVYMHSQGTTKPGGYPAWMLYPTQLRPVLPNTGNLEFSFDLIVDEANSTAANVRETDVILVTGGYKYNFSGQQNITEGGMIQIADSKGNWVDTGIKLGILSPNVRHSLSWKYSFDTTKHTGSVVSFALDGVGYSIPTSLQNIPASVCNWTEGAYPQFQMGSLPAGVYWSTILSDVVLTWS